MSGENVQLTVRMLEMWVWPTSPLITEPKIELGQNRAGGAFDSSLQDYGLQSAGLDGNLGAHFSLVQKGHLKPRGVG